MSLRLNLSVSYADGSAVAVTTAAADLIAFEETYDRSVATLDDDWRFTDIAYLAWHALKRTGKTDKEFLAWSEDVDMVRFGDEQVNVVPLESTQPTG